MSTTPASSCSLHLPATCHSISTPRLTITSSLSFSGHVSSFKIRGLSASSGRRGGGAAGARMAESAAASYATAIADVANGNGALEVTAADMEKIDKIFSEKEVFGFFINPTIPLETKRKVIDEISATSKLQPHTANLLNILIDMKRIDLVIDVVKEFESVYNVLTNTEPAVVTSVVKLESQHLAQIAKGVQRLTGAQNVRIKTKIDPSLVAGFTIRYGNSGSKMVDFSVKKQLQDIAEQLDLGDLKLAA